METLTVRSVPVAVLALWVLYEVVRVLAARRGGNGIPPVLRLAGWALRPWAAWAVLNAVFRWQWQRGFNNRRTFPFFANLWRENQSFAERLAWLGGRPATTGWVCVVLALLVVLVLLAREIVRRERPGRGFAAGVLTLLFALAFALNFSVASLPRGAGLAPGERGSLLSCWHAHATMLYAVPLVRNTDHYLSNFLELQPQLRRTIHGLSHPPGASLSMYWIGAVMGVKHQNIRADRVRLRYAIGLTLFGGLSVFLVYGLGRALWDSRRVGLTAALLWLTAPLVLAYGTFAQDMLYAVFFIAALLLTWRVATADRMPWAGMALLGVVFFCQILLNYSWCIATTIFALFVPAVAWRRRRAWRPALLRTVVPLAVMTVLAAGFLLHYRLDYLRMYLVSRAYVDLWYPFEGLYQYLTALIGGQIDLFLLMGSVTLSAFLTCGSNGGGRRGLSERGLFLALILGVYALPILFGPTCLKMETARCWNWVAAAPIVFAAAALLRQSAPRLFVGGAVAVSVLTYGGMRLFLNFAP